MPQVVKIIVMVVFILICVALTFLVLMQEGKQQGLGAIGGIADSYWGKNKGRSMEGVLVKSTTFLAIAFMILALLLNIPILFG
ncbi:MAG: preprotein translocase subunit SecG [Lachnospiraceae bacterium]|jgi:preprotein translocase subunit SecG|nr:preprotein translocase subunit SecG [Lachnospiraceae bacterium]